MCRLPHLLLCVAACLTTSATVNADENGPAPSSYKSVADLTISQWVQPNEAGLLKGRVVTHATDGASVAVAKASVALVDKDGNVLRSEALTDVKGEFVVKNVKPGVYALSARSGNLIAACAMHILATVDGDEKQFASKAEIAAAAIDYATLRDAIVRYLPKTTKPSPSALKPTISKEQLGALAEQVIGTEAFRIAQIDGGMVGQIFSAGVQGAELPTANVTNVFILQDGKEIARTVTNDKGEFQVASLKLGSYSIMAVGPEGLGLAGFELVNEETLKTADQVTKDGERFVGLLSRLRARRCARKFGMQVAPVCNTCSTDVCSTCEAPAVVEQAVCFQPAATVVEAPMAVTPVAVQSSCGCGQPAATCGCGIPVDPCGCGGTIVADQGFVEGGIVEGVPMEGEIIDGGIIDGGFVDGVPVDGFGSSLAGGGGYAPGYAGGFGGGGGFSGGGGGGGLLGGGGLGGLAGLAGIGGLVAAVATSDDDDNNFVPPAPIASPVAPN
jgi:protocatechuate 3,4-dioxygenase beta subunit